MNRSTRSFELLVLALAAACGPDAGALPGNGPAASGSEPALPGAVFNRAMREQLAARGVPVYGGKTPEGATPTTGGTRTTIEQSLIVRGYPMVRLTDPDPTTEPAMYAVQLGLRMPLGIIVLPSGMPDIDPNRPETDPEKDRESCSATLIAADSVLTAAHCVINWKNIGTNPTTGRPVFQKVRAYSINARPRRNGEVINHHLHGEIGVRKSFWDYAKWPRDSPTPAPSTEPFYDEDQDYAVLRLKSVPNPALVPASIGTEPSPTGKYIEMVHYPDAFNRHAGMYDSIGDVDTLRSPFTRVYRHRASMQHGSSGAGVFDVEGRGTVIGINVAEGASSDPFPNRALMLTPELVTTIGTWLATPIF